MNKRKLTKFGIAAIIAAGAVTPYDGYIPSLKADAKAVSNKTVKAPLRSTVVTPKNMLQNPNFNELPNSFDKWTAHVNNSVINPLPRFKDGRFIVQTDREVTAKQETSKNGLHIWNLSYDKIWFSQKVHVVKGENYKLSMYVTASPSGGGWLLPSHPRLLTSIGETVSLNVGEKINDSKTRAQEFNYKAPKTCDITVAVGTSSDDGAGMPEISITNLSFKNTDVTPPKAPVVNPVYTDKNLVTGTAEPDTKVIVTTEDNQTFEGDTDANGNYSVQISRQIYNHNISVSNQDVAGNVSNPTVVQARQGELAKPTVNPVTNKSVAVTGEADLAVNVQVKVIKPNKDEKDYIGNTDEKGHFSVSLPTGVEYGDKVQVQTSALGKTSPISEVTVSDEAKPKAPTVENVYTDTTLLKGLGDAGNKVEVTLPDKTKKETTVQADGKFSVSIPTQAEGAKMEVVQIKPSGLRGDVATVTVLPGRLPQPVVKEVTDKSTVVEGTGTPNAHFILLIDDAKGTLVHKYEGTVDSTGHFAVNIDAPHDDYKISLELANEKQTSQPLVIPVKDVTAPAAPKVSPVKEIAKQVTGTTEKDAKVIVKRVSDNKVIGEATADENGKYVVSIPTQKIGEVLTITATDKAGNVSEATKVTVEACKGTLAPKPYVLGDATISGTYTDDIVKGHLIINDAAVNWGGTFKNGQFSYYVGDKIKAGDVVTLEGYSAANQKLTEQKIEVKSSAAKGVLTPSDYKLGDMNISGTYSGEIDRANLIVNGKSVSWGGNFTGNKFSYYVGNKIKAGDVITLVGYSKYGEKLDEKTVKFASIGAVGTLGINEYNLGDITLTGTYTGEIARAHLLVNGKVVSIGGSFKDGQFSYYVGNKIKAGDTVVLEGYSALNELLVKETVSFAKSKTVGKITPNDYKIGDTLLEGNFTGDVKKLRLLINNKPISWGGNFANGTFSYYVKSHLISQGDVVTLEAYDKDDVKLDTKTVKVLANSEGSITTATYKLGDTVIKGTFNGNIEIAKVYINDVVQKWGGTFSEGNFTYYLGKNKVKATDKVMIEGYSKDKKLVDVKQVTITK